MRLTHFFAAAVVLAACSKESKQAEPPPPSGTSASVTADTLTIGAANRVTEGKSYRVEQVVVAVERIGLANGVDDQGREDHWVAMDLTVTASGSAPVKITVDGDGQANAAGLVFRVDKHDYRTGDAGDGGTLHVEKR
jgi:hypothetical protein